MTCNPFDADSDYEDDLGSRRSSSSSTRRVSFSEPPRRGSIVIDGRRGSLFSIPEMKERGSVFALFEDPYGDNGGPLRLTLSLVPEDVDTTPDPDSDTMTPPFQHLTAQQTYQLRKRVLYKGEYRILNISVVTVIVLVVGGIIFLSSWHYTSSNWWTMYIVLGCVVCGVVGVLGGVTGYLKYRRFYRKGCTTTDLIFRNDAGGDKMKSGSDLTFVSVSEEGDDEVFVNEEAGSVASRYNKRNDDFVLDT